MHDAGILPCRDVRLATQATWKEKPAAYECAIGEPIADCRSGLFGDLKLDGPAGLSLNDAGAVSYLAVNASSLTCNRTRSQPRSLLSMARLNNARSRPAPLKLEPNADCPDLLRFQRAFLANQLALVPWASRKAHQSRDRGCMNASLIPTAPAAARAIHWLRGP